MLWLEKVPTISHLDRPLYPFLLVFFVAHSDGANNSPTPIVSTHWLSHGWQLYMGTTLCPGGLPAWCGESASIPVVEVQDSQGEAVSQSGGPHRCGSICISTSDALLRHSTRKHLVVLRISLRRPIQIITACTAHAHPLGKLDPARYWDISPDEQEASMS